MRYPEFLKENGTIGFIAPSFGCAIEPYRQRFDNALNIFKEMGYSIILGPNCYADSGVGISNTPEACGKELNEAMTTGESDVIITCGGGELMCEVVPFINYDQIKEATPKWYMGYSDNTNYTFLSATLADTAAIYGPCAPAFGREPWHESISDALKLLTCAKNQIKSYGMWEHFEEDSEEPDALDSYILNKTTEFFYHNTNDKKEAHLSGRLLGGCVDILNILVGTKYDKVKEFTEKYKKDGIIWFLECCDLNPLDMRRDFWHMKEAGWFENAKGFLIGRPLHFGEDVMGVNQYNAVTEILGELQVPIIMDLDIGHLPPMMPIVCGSTADIDAVGNEITIQYTYK